MTFFTRDSDKFGLRLASISATQSSKVPVDRSTVRISTTPPGRLIVTTRGAEPGAACGLGVANDAGADR